MKSLLEIPFLPISFFKTRKVITGHDKSEIIFSSSGTTGNLTSAHHVKDILFYQKSYLGAFENFYGKASEYCVLALLPSYLEREGSSLIYMVDDLIKKSGHHDSGFYLDDLDG
ncbi:MAG: acyl transferase, partial [Aurantibacter sp.]